MARPKSDIAPRIVHAARGRFLHHGVDGASLRQIAEDAGTNLGMVYYYFPSKDDLFLAVVEEVYVALLADLERALTPARPVAQRLHALYERLGQLSRDELLVLRIVVREVLASPTRLGRLIERFKRGHLPLVLALVRDGLAAGLFSRDLPAALVFGAMMVLGGPAQALLQHAGPLLPLPALPRGAALSATLVEVLLHGVAARGRPITARRPSKVSKKPAPRRRQR